MVKSEKLYKVVFNALYAEGKKNDLTEEDKNEVREDYKANFLAIRQLFLGKVDAEGAPYPESTIRRNKRVMESLQEEMKASKVSGTAFDKYILDYSDNIVGEAPFVSFVRKGKLKQDIEKEILPLAVGAITPSVIESDSGFHIIMRSSLNTADEAKSYLPVLFDEKRASKLLLDINKELENVNIVFEKEYDNLDLK